MKSRCRFEDGDEVTFSRAVVERDAEVFQVGCERDERPRDGFAGVRRDRRQRDRFERGDATRREARQELVERGPAARREVDGDERF